MTAGLSSSGFVIKSLEDILAEIEAEQLANIDPALDVSADSLNGQNNGIFANQVAEIWELALAVYRAFDPDTATGEALDAIGAITGATRLAAAPSTVTVTCGGTPTTVLLAGRVVSVAGTGDRFVSLADATIGGGGTVDVEFESEETGPVVANAATLTVIETPVSGWATATNALDAALGNDQESDADFRARRLALLASGGAGTVEAIRAGLLSVPGVSEAFAFENTGTVPDVDGVPGKAFESVVRGGVDQDIADEIWQRKPAGIEAFGGTVVVVDDSQGFQHNIGFSRPTVIDIWLDITVSVDPASFPGDGADQIKAAIIELGDSLGVGGDVIYTQFFTPAYTISGVLDVTALTVDIIFPPVGTSNIVIASRELADFDTSRIAVTVV